MRLYLEKLQLDTSSNHRFQILSVYDENLNDLTPGFDVNRIFYQLNDLLLYVATTMSFPIHRIELLEMSDSIRQKLMDCEIQR